MKEDDDDDHYEWKTWLRFSLRIVTKEKGNEGGKGKCDFEAVRFFFFFSLELQENKIK